MREEIQEMLKDALALFPEDKKLKDNEKMTADMFWSKYSKESEKEKELIAVNEDVNMVENETKENSDGKTKRKLSFELPSFSLNITQLREEDKEPEVESEIQEDCSKFVDSLINKTPFLSSQEQNIADDAKDEGKKELKKR